MVDSLAYSVKTPECGGLILVGDATGFIDPFTGEGIYLSLRSSQLAVKTIANAFDKSDFSENQFKVYDRMCEKEFKKKIILSKVLQYLIYNPSVCIRVVNALALEKELSGLLIGVIGDYIPASKVVCFEYFFRLFSEVMRSRSLSLQARQCLTSQPVLDEKN